MRQSAKRCEGAARGNLEILHFVQDDPKAGSDCHVASLLAMTISDFFNALEAGLVALTVTEFLEVGTNESTQQ